MTDCGYGNHTYRYCRRCKNPTSCSKCGKHPDGAYKERIEALEAAALKVVETSGQVDHSGIYAYEMDYRRAIQRLAALLPRRGEL